MTDNRLMVTVEEAMRMISLKRTKFYQLVNSGTIKTKKVGSRRLVLVSSLEELAQ